MSVSEVITRLQELCGYAVSAIPHPGSTVWNMMNISVV